MDWYYSSDEDVAWGPVTIDEVLNNLTKRSNPSVSSRQTFGSFTYTMDNPTEAKKLPTKEELKALSKVEKIKQHEPIPDLLKTAAADLDFTLSSEYYTADDKDTSDLEEIKNTENNETSEVEASSSTATTSFESISSRECFFDKVSKLLNIPKVYINNEPLNSSDLSRICKDSTDEEEDITSDDSTDQSTSSKREDKFIPITSSSTSNYATASNTFEISTDDDVEASRQLFKSKLSALKGKYHKVSLLNDMQCTNLVENTIIISSDEENSMEEQIEQIIDTLDKNLEIEKIKPENYYSVSGCCTLDSSGKTDLYQQEEEVHIKNEASAEYDASVEYDEESVQSSPLSSYSDNLYETREPSLNTSADSEQGFNDTLEAVDFMLKAQANGNLNGKDFELNSQHNFTTRQDFTTKQSSTSKQAITINPKKSPLTKTRNIASPHPKDLKSTPKPPLCKTPDTKRTVIKSKAPYLMTAIPSRIPKKLEALKTQQKDNTFKVPKMPTLKYPPLPKVKSISPANKNIVSPVGIYINRSPMPIIKRNACPQRDLCKKQYAEEHKIERKENIPMNLPTVIYKPAKTTVVMKKPGQNLPNNIKKLISPAKHTMHERRQCYKSTETVERRLACADVTLAMNESSLDNTQEISVHVEKSLID